MSWLPQGWGGITGGMSPQMRTPGIFGDAPIGPGGVMGEPQAQAPQQDAKLAMAAALLGGSQSGQGFNSILGSALMAGQHARMQAKQFGMQQQHMDLQQQDAQQMREYRQAQIQQLQDPKGQDPASVKEFEFARSKGYEGSYEDWKQGFGTKAEPPASIAEYNLAKSQGYTKPFQTWLADRAKMTVGAPFQLGTVGGAVGGFDRTGGGFNPISSPQEEAAAAAAQRAAVEQAAKEAEARGARSATFSSDISKIDDEIERTRRLRKEFKDGKYQTGPVAGILPNYRTAAQDLKRESGKDTLSAISSATFGALSEGERAFLRDLGVSDSVNEESNVNLLDQREAALVKAKERLLKQNAGDRRGASGSWDAPAPAGGGWKIEPAN